MSYDRACPLLLNAASPIPADSLAHWTQYQRIKLVDVAPDKISLLAECQNEEEHRFLHDWCSWLVSELDQARRLMTRSERHADWIPPIATIDQASNNTIKIGPAPGARYIPARWRFELDVPAVFDRLIFDALDTPWDFLRELLQNAADATRCRMFADLLEREGPVPEYPTQVDERIRSSYPIRVTLSEVEVVNELSKESEIRQVLVVEDSGIGMDTDVIQKYLLQVGQSFYTTQKFRQTYQFVASSRFGVGFLSVFGVSNDVTIETYKPTSEVDTTPLKIRLTGPRSYLLTEKGDRRKSGTKISVVLRKPAATNQITNLIKQWCGRLEFPVFINDLGDSTEVAAEKGKDFVLEVPNVLVEGAKIIIRSFPINKEGIEGDLFVLAHINDKEERWGISSWAANYVANYPQAEVPKIPDSRVFFHGISTHSQDEYDYQVRDNFSSRIDLRGERFQPTLARSGIRFNKSSKGTFNEIQPIWDEILRHHLDSGAPNESGKIWAYKQQIFNKVGSWEFWLEEKATIPAYQEGVMKEMSLQDLVDIDILEVAMMRGVGKALDPRIPLPTRDNTLMAASWVNNLAGDCREYMFENRQLESVELLDDFVICSWKQTAKKQNRDRWDTIEFAAFDSELIGGVLNNVSMHNSNNVLVLNLNHAFTKWYLAVSQACAQELYGLKEKHIERLIRLLNSPLKHGGHEFDKLQSYLKQWQNLPNLPKELLAYFDLTKDQFMLGTRYLE
jgi:hypothetical protein